MSSYFPEALSHLSGRIGDIESFIVAPTDCKIPDIVDELTDIKCIFKALCGEPDSDGKILEQIENLRTTIKIIETELGELISGLALRLINEAGAASSSCSTAIGEFTVPDEKPAPFSSLKDIIPSIIVSIAPGVNQIRCLDQTTLPLGGQRCGFHALKNALCAWAAAKGYDIGPREYSEIFGDQEVYKNVEKSMLDMRGSGKDDDASDIQLRICLRAIVLGKLIPFENSLPISWQSHDFSLFNVGTDNFSGPSQPALVSSDLTSLESLANLKELTMRKGAGHHAFLIGGNGHWTTMIYEKDDKGEVFWYGLDSMHNEQGAFLRNISLIQEMMDNIDTRAYRDYYTSIGDDLHNRSRCIHPEGYLLDSCYGTIFLDPESGEETYLSKIHAATRFLSRMGWLAEQDHPAHAENIQNIKLILGFYKSTHPEDPRIKEIEALLGDQKD